MGCGGMDWIDLAQGGDQSRCKVTNLGFDKMI
jgi:hypothetical protein